MPWRQRRAVADMPADGAAHRAGLQVVPWTANTREAWEALVAAGVDGIITDDPEGLAAFLKEKGLR